MAGGDVQTCMGGALSEPAASLASAVGAVCPAPSLQLVQLLGGPASTGDGVLPATPRPAHCTGALPARAHPECALLPSRTCTLQCRCMGRAAFLLSSSAPCCQSLYRGTIDFWQGCKLQSSSHGVSACPQAIQSVNLDCIRVRCIRWGAFSKAAWLSCIHHAGNSAI